MTILLMGIIIYLSGLIAYVFHENIKESLSMHERSLIVESNCIKIRYFTIFAVLLEQQRS